MTGSPRAEPARLGVIGGSGLYRFLDEVTEVEATTPWGAPSGPVAIGRIADRSVAFLPRHGPHHELPPHRINYRANLWALRDLGVRRVFAPCASGSLRRELAPGHFVVCDQFIDRTAGRPGTYFDGPVVNHVSTAEPYCPELSRAALDAGRAAGIDMHPAGTVVVVQGPRFSTRAESRWFAAAGCDVINMTQCPEVVLARELGLCYATIALVTDYDAGLDGRPDIAPVNQAEAFAVIEDNAERVRHLLFTALASVDLTPSCGCRAASNGVEPAAPGQGPRVVGPR